MTHPQEGGTGGEVSEILFFSAKSKRRPSLIYSMQIIPVCLSIVARRKGVSATRRGGLNWTPISLLVGHPCKLFHKFRVLTQRIDTTTPDGRLFFHITESFDQFQRELISENTRAGLLAARKHGRKGGRPRAMDDDKVRLAESLLRDKQNYPFINDVIKELQIGRTAFYRYFPPEKIREFRSTHSETD